MPMTQPPAHPYTCPCCGHLVFDEPPGSFSICGVCFWEDDYVQLSSPDYPGGANRPSLVESQRTYQTVGAMEERFIPSVRPARRDEPLDPTWRPVDMVLDAFPKYGRPSTWELIDALLPPGEELRGMMELRKEVDAWYQALDIYRADGTHYRSELKFPPLNLAADPTLGLYYWRPGFRAAREKMSRQRSHVVRTPEGFEEFITWDGAG